MTPTEQQRLERVKEAAQAYVDLVNPAAPSHKAIDAVRRAFDALEEVVNAAVAADMAERSVDETPNAEKQQRPRCWKHRSRLSIQSLGRWS